MSRKHIHTLPRWSSPNCPSCTEYCAPVGPRIRFTLDGERYERTVHATIYHRAMKPDVERERYVIVGLEVVSLDELADVEEVVR